VIEILAGELDKAIEELQMNAKKTYEIQNKPWEYCETYQVWELSDEEFDKLCEIDEDDWKSEYGWWRGAKGSNLGGVSYRYNINNHYIKAWDGYSRINFMEENKNCKPEDKWFRDRKYKTLLQYFCEELGVSTERNVCAVAVDLAEQNGITMSELFKKFQG
jgi:hypothetical protein